MKLKHATIINGNINGLVSPLDRGLAYGDGVFRTLKIVNGQPTHWPLHYQKLVADCGAIGIVCPSPELLISDFSQIFTPDETAVAKIIITRGDGERGYAPPAVTAPMRIVIKSDMPQYLPSHFSDGVNLHLCETRLSLQPKLAGVKHLNRLENVLARMEWSDPLIAEGLMLDTNDNVIECTSANVFARYGDMLVTPNLESCGIAGVTRQRILGLAKTLKLSTKIETFKLEKLLEADEVLICNSLYDVWQVRSVAGKTWPMQSFASAFCKVLNK